MGLSFSKLSFKVASVYILPQSSDTINDESLAFLKFGEFGESMLFRQTLLAKTLIFFNSVMAFKEIQKTLLVQMDFLANSLNCSHAKLSSFMVCLQKSSDMLNQNNLGVKNCEANKK